MKKKTDLRIMKTKASLYRGFMSLLKNKSFDEISISNICSASFINRSTYYDHFNDKYELLQSMLSDMNEDFLKSFTMDSCKKLSDGLLFVLKQYLLFMEDNLEVYSLITNIPNPSLAKDLIAKGILEASKKELVPLYPTRNTISFDDFVLFYASGFASIIFLSLQNHTFQKENLLTIFQELLSHL